MDVLILDCGSISGESMIKGYEGKIEVLSYSHGLEQPITSGAGSQKRTSGKPNFQDLTVTKYFDLASVGLIEHCNRAMVLPTVTLTVGESENATVLPFLVYTLTNALVSAISVGGGGGGKPQETVTFNYTAISWAYKLQTATGGSAQEGSTTWNLATNSPS